MVKEKSRYDVAEAFRKQWNRIIWRGDERTQGVFFNNRYGYVVDQTYAVRMEHHEEAPSVFYVPHLDEKGDDEVLIEYPYKQMKTEEKKYNVLFTEPLFKENDLNRLFEGDFTEQITLPVQPLKEFIERIPVKRIRDRTLFILQMDRSETTAKVFLVGRRFKEYSVAERSTIEVDRANISQTFSVSLNANSLLHALLLFSSSQAITFSKYSDRIVVTNHDSEPKVEAVISSSVQFDKREIAKW